MLAEKLRHFIQVFFISAECLARFTVAVADDEMCVGMLPVDMDSEHHIKSSAVKIPVSKLLCDLKGFFIGQLFIRVE